jgi:NAD(P)-dependent dehydrogenase (short-subunit alcohol dehydrogenase family)
VEAQLLAGQVAIVTGAGAGIGQAIARLFAAEGARVVVADLSPAAGEATAAAIRAAGGTVDFRQTDVSQAAQVRELVEWTVVQHGALNILVNNAGIGIAANVVDTAEEDWDRLMAINLKGPYLGCKFAIPHMLAQGGGIIINTASAAGLVAVGDRAAYCASKGGVIALTRSIAVDYATRNIRCNCICPGTVETPWVDRIIAGYPDPAAARAAMVARQPLGRLGTAEEIAHCALYLASPYAAFVHGSALVIDGGFSAR